MSDPSWPYDDPEIPVDPADLFWSCPVGICDCAGGEGHEPLEFSVMLCTHEGERMSHARCRVWLNGVVRNDVRNANHDGWMTVAVPHDVNSVFVEWAPEDTPLGPPYPYRKRYFVSLGEDETSEEADRRRLHNLGFTVYDTLEENVEDFQVEYDYDEITGHLPDIVADLRKFHDEGHPRVRRHEPPGTPAVTEDDPLPPPDDQVRPDLATDDGVLTETGTPFSAKRNFVPVNDAPEALDDSPPIANPEPPQPPPPGPPPSLGLDTAGSGPGTARTEVAIPELLDVIRRGKHRFEWVGIYVEIDDGGTIVGGFFWTFRDALTTPVSLRVKSGSSVTSRQVDLRVPCSAAETFEAAKLIRAKQADLPSPPNAVGGPQSTALLDSLPLTARVSDIRYVGAQTQITPCSGFMNKEIPLPGGKKKVQAIPIEVGTAKHHLCIEKKLKAAAGSTKPSQVGWMADPGKIWVLAPDSNRQAVNYGWHVPRNEVKRDGAKHFWLGTPAFLAVSRPPYSGAVMGKDELWVLQTEGRRHDKSHKDYSQVLLLMAGWCVIARGTTVAWTRTRDVLTHPVHHRLISHYPNPYRDDQLPPTDDP
ncbi:MAG: hypothetical protein KC731_03560 [Myxococcales bacterium]|nr:hypothetical protein [Myxococcales bacterium]